MSSTRNNVAGTRVRYCSFCNISTNHTILNCDSPHSYQVENSMYTHAAYILSTSNKDALVNYFTNDVPLKWVRLLACRLNIRSTDRIDIMIDNIYIKLLQSPQYITALSSIQRQNETTATVNTTNRMSHVNTNIMSEREYLEYLDAIYNDQTDEITNLLAEIQVLREQVSLREPVSLIEHLSMEPILLQSDILTNNINNTQTTRNIVPLFKPVISVLIDDKYENQIECPICYTDVKKNEYTETNCQHKYCIDCMQKMYKTAVGSYKHNLSCAICRANIRCLYMYLENPALTSFYT